MAATRNIVIKMMRSTHTRTPCNILALPQGTCDIAMDNKSPSVCYQAALLVILATYSSGARRKFFSVECSAEAAWSVILLCDRQKSWQENVRRNIPQVILKHQRLIPSCIQGPIKKVRSQCHSNLSTCNLVELHQSGILLYNRFQWAFQSYAETYHG